MRRARGAGRAAGGASSSAWCSPGSGARPRKPWRTPSSSWKPDGHRSAHARRELGLDEASCARRSARSRAPPRGAAPACRRCRAAAPRCRPRPSSSTRSARCRARSARRRSGAARGRSPSADPRRPRGVRATPTWRATAAARARSGARSRPCTRRSCRSAPSPCASRRRLRPGDARDGCVRERPVGGLRQRLDGTRDRCADRARCRVAATARTASRTRPGCRRRRRRSRRAGSAARARAGRP